MKKTVYGIVAVIFLIMSENSCKTDNKVTLAASPQYSMNFTLSAGTAPLLLGPTNVVTNATLRYYLNYLLFYVGYPRLEKADGTEVPLTNLFAVEFYADPSTVAAPTSVFNTEFNFPVPAGTYTGIKFGIGVPPKLDTLQFLNAHNTLTDPYNQAWGLVWTMKDIGAKYYTIRNIGLDLIADTSKLQNQAVNRDYSFHILNDQDTVNLYHEITLADNFSVANGENHNVTINLDFNNVFFNSSNPINLRTSVGTDMFNNDTTGIKLGEAINGNFYNSLTLKQK